MRLWGWLTLAQLRSMAKEQGTRLWVVVSQPGQPRGYSPIRLPVGMPRWVFRWGGYTAYAYWQQGQRTEARHLAGRILRGHLLAVCCPPYRWYCRERAAGMLSNWWAMTRFLLRDWWRKTMEAWG